VPDVRQAFLDDPITLDGHVGKAVAKILKLLGISIASDTEAILEGVYTLIQCWAVTVPENYENLMRSYDGFLVEFTTSSKTLVADVAVVLAKLREAFELGVLRAANALMDDRRPRGCEHVRRRRKRLFEEYVA
jgi:hypothetical protein